MTATAATDVAAHPRPEGDLGNGQRVREVPSMPGDKASFQIGPTYRTLWYELEIE